MTAPELSIGAYRILRQAVNATAAKKSARGAVNCWTASGRVVDGSPLWELLDQGLMVSQGELRPGTVKYVATAEGMRVAGLSPREITRCFNLGGRDVV